ncbi:hypothetical protein E2C01_031308 [Portunus trituberculatus]|uniref:Uncharacterized protein n=1 Tax=Portunus trituberculatus TaxID=210409 RepID=A0A5B7EWH8_PORTR|nr:hypothetical protein [Portunus trituberculatus]
MNPGPDSSPPCQPTLPCPCLPCSLPSSRHPNTFSPRLTHIPLNTPIPMLAFLSRHPRPFTPDCRVIASPFPHIASHPISVRLTTNSPFTLTSHPPHPSCYGAF